MTLKDHRILADYMDFRGESVRSLATKVSATIKTSPAMIGHLRTGARKNTNKKRAKAIEKALNAPPGALFVAAVSRVSQDAA